MTTVYTGRSFSFMDAKTTSETQRLSVRSNRYRGYRGDYWVRARLIERLPNGAWRVDYSGGLVEMFDAKPETRTVES